MLILWHCISQESREEDDAAALTNAHDDGENDADDEVNISSFVDPENDEFMDYGNVGDHQSDANSESNDGDKKMPESFPVESIFEEKGTST